MEVLSVVMYQPLSREIIDIWCLAEAMATVRETMNKYSETVKGNDLIRASVSRYKSTEEFCFNSKC